MWTRETSLNQTLSPLINSSTPKIPQPPSAVVTLFAIRFASSSAAGVMG